jgi:hypothetical protein
LGHLLYGAVLALVYERLLRRYTPRRTPTAAESAQTAPALWELLVVLTLSLLVLQG